MAYDINLGQVIHKHLTDLNIETPMAPLPVSSLFMPKGEPISVAQQMELIKHGHYHTMQVLGLDLQDDSLKDTPSRVGKMYVNELFYGLDYTRFPACTVFENKANYDEMLSVCCTVESFCEHHFLPFIGKAYVAYIPGEKFLGLSKFNRVVDFFSHRPQVQERLTEQISATFRHILKTDDVAVVIKAEHYCTKLRGIKDSCGQTTTSKLSGRFRTVPELRAEFIALTRV